MTFMNLLALVNFVTFKIMCPPVRTSSVLSKVTLRRSSTDAFSRKLKTRQMSEERNVVFGIVERKFLRIVETKREILKINFDKSKAVQRA